MLASQITSNRPKLPTAAIVGSRVQDDTNRPTAPNDIISKNKPSRPAATRPQSMLVDHASDSGISAISTITTAMNPSTPRNLPSTISVSETGAENSTVIAPVFRSSANNRIVKIGRASCREGVCQYV